MTHDSIDTITKNWGWTRCVARGPYHEVWHAFSRGGGYSSRHLHRSKANAFYVVSGQLCIRIYNHAGEPISEHTLTAGESVTVRAGDPHRFEAAGDTHFVETYFRPDGSAINVNDIVRADVGGIKED